MSGGGKIGDLVKKLETMADPAWRAELSQKLAEEAQRQYQKDFARESDPYGRPWIPSQKKTGKTLIKTGYLRASGEVEVVSSEGFRFRVYAPYGQFHQSGTHHIPQRMIVPSAALGLGTWGAPFSRIAVAAVRGLLK